MKRFFDIAFVVVTAPLVLPVLLLLAAMVRLTSKGPAFYWSVRIGKDNRPFWMPKLRTMRVGAPEMATHLLGDSQHWITPLGRFLRRSSLDELPQFWNVLNGEMTVVGPRPALHNQHDLISQRTQYGVHNLVPGVTGWAQINGRDELIGIEKVRRDVWYQQHQSFLLDLWIILSTAGAVIAGMVRYFKPSPSKSFNSFTTGMLLVAVLAFALRASVAVRSHVPCRDGVFYLMQAVDRRLAVGGESVGVGGHVTLELNLFPLTLRGLFHLGFDPYIAGKWLNVLLASMVVFPLGLLTKHSASLYHQLTDSDQDRIALWAILLYATHPELIEWSSELVRDPMFWFLVSTGLWMQWRIASRPTLFLHVCSISCLLLCTFVRIEGLLLFFPFAVWSLIYQPRAVCLRNIRSILAVLVVIAAACFTLRFTSLSTYVDPVGIRSTPLTVFYTIQDRFWSLTQLSQLPIAILDVARSAASAFAPLIGLLIVVGLLLFREHQSQKLLAAIIPCALALFGGIVAHRLVTGNTTPRYMTTLILLASPFAARNLLLLFHSLPTLRARRALETALVCLLVAIGFAKSYRKDFSSRIAKAEAGRWVAGHFGDHCVSVCSSDLARYVAYYSNGTSWTFPDGTSFADINRIVTAVKPSVALFTENHTPNLETKAGVSQGTVPIGGQPPERIAFNGRLFTVYRLAAKQTARSNESTKLK